jgi:glycosyltransferase involved in cell wall biosynthesis
MKVLLFSPLAGRDPLSGDTSYTEALLADPAPGVSYTTYADALEEGTLVIRGRRPRSSRDILDLPLLAVRTVEMAARRTGMAFREPTWFVSIAPGTFDVVHQHLFSVRQIGHTRVPIVSSAGFPLPELYRHREGWGEKRLRRAVTFERRWAIGTGAHVPWLLGVDGAVMMTYSESSREYIAQHGSPSMDIRIASTAIPSEPPAVRRPGGGVLRLLFVGRDFRRKGGPSALAGFEELRRRGVDCKLTVVTSATADPARSATSGVTWHTDLPRDVVLQDVLPRTDVLLAPTNSDCGAPYAVLEAMRARVPVVLTDLPWLDGRLAPPGVERCDGSAPGIAAAVERHLARGIEEAGAAAQALQGRVFSTAALGERLLEAYRDAAGRPRP